MKNRKKILVIEDSKSLQKQINSFLSIEGFQVYEATNGQEEINLAEEHSPSLISGKLARTHRLSTSSVSDFNKMLCSHFGFPTC